MIIVEVALVRTTINPFESSLALFQTVYEIAFVAASIWPFLGALTVLFVVLPHAFVLAALAHCGLLIHTKSIGHFGATVGALGHALLACVGACVGIDVFAKTLALIIEPLAYVVLATRVDEPSLASGAALHPLALVDEAIRPDLSASAMFLAPFPLAGVHFADVTDLGRVNSEVVLGGFQVFGGEVLAVPVVHYLEEHVVVLDCPVYDEQVLYWAVAARYSGPGKFV